jgi:hypothetical protein
VTVWDAPNQQVVRDDQSAPWDEGAGGTPGTFEAQAAQVETGEADLDAMTNAELLEYAQQIGVSPANNNMSKEELRDGVDAKLAEA